MVGLEAPKERIEQALHQPYGEKVAPDMLKDEDPAPLPKYPPGLDNGAFLIRNAAQRKSEHDSVELLSGEGQRLGVSLNQSHQGTHLCCVARCDAKHRLADVQAGDPA
jgi:hypothetical protein